MNRLQEKYQNQITKKLQEEFKIKNFYAVPKIIKVVINVGIGSIVKDKQAMEKAINTMQSITGQKPLIKNAKKAIAEFKIREGDPVGLTTTLRSERMYQFIDKLFSLVLAKVRDFGGVKRSAFDKKGNYTLGLKEQIIFPEVDYDKIDKIRGLEITFVTNAGDRKKSFRLLELLGMPFEKVPTKSSSMLGKTGKRSISGTRK